MGYEVDFMAVGDESQSGDAIALRFGNLRGAREEQTIVVIDGGFKDTGERLANHINHYYGGPSMIDWVISTHPDQDHIGGLETILDEFQIGTLLMHKPWAHPGWQGASEERQAAMDAARSLHDKAVGKGVDVREPFAEDVFHGAGGYLKILGPTQSFYESLLSDFAQASRSASMLQKFSAQVGEKFRIVQESWGKETLTDEGETSATNNSSVVLQVVTGGRRLLFTGDAGIPALEEVAVCLEYGAASEALLRMIQIPHHGSRRNVGPSILNRIIGGIVGEGVTRGIMGVASCATKGEPKHPNKRVLNAFKRRRVSCYKTQGIILWERSSDAPERPNYKVLSPCPLYDEVEEED